MNEGIDPSVLEIFRRRQRDTKKEQGAVGTQMAMRATQEGNAKPTHSDVTWQMDLMDMSTRGTSVGNTYSMAMLCVDVGTRRVRGQLMKTRRGADTVAAFRAMRGPGARAQGFVDRQGYSIHEYSFPAVFA